MMRERKRGPYKRRFHQPMFPDLVLKTTTPEGKREYYKRYMRLTRSQPVRARRFG